MSTKRRLSVTVRPAWVEAAEAAVAGGRAASLSAWVDDALRLKVERDRRLAALAAFVEAYEVEHGVIEGAEIRLATRRASSRAVPVRGAPKRGRRRR